MTATDDDKFGEWVTDHTEIDAFNATGECVCGDSDIASIGRFHEVYHCGECDREFVRHEDEAVHPDTLLETDNEGLVHYSEAPSAFHLLTEQDWGVQDYIEFPSATDEKWLWAADGLYIGYLLYRHETLRATVIAAGFRKQGHGGEFLETWYEQINDDPLEVIAYDRTKPFLNDLEIPIKYI